MTDTSTCPECGWRDGDAVPSTAGLCDFPATHQQHALAELADPARELRRLEQGDPAEWYDPAHLDHP